MTKFDTVRNKFEIGKTYTTENWVTRLSGRNSVIISVTIVVLARTARTVTYRYVDSDEIYKDRVDVGLTGYSETLPCRVPGSGVFRLNAFNSPVIRQS